MSDLSISHYDFDQRAWINHDDAMRKAAILRSVEELGWPAPEFFKSNFGYLKARCPECQSEHLLRGYAMHCRRAHDDPTRYNAHGIKHQSQGDPYIERHDPIAWQRLHEESMARLSKREHPLPGRTVL